MVKVFSNILNFAFFMIIIFFIIFGWSYKFTYNLTMSITCSLFFCIMFAIILYLFLNTKNYKKELSKKLDKEFKTLSQLLLINSSKDILQFFITNLKTNPNFIIKNSTIKMLINSQLYQIKFCFFKQTILDDDLYNILKNNTDKLVIVAMNFNIINQNFNPLDIILLPFIKFYKENNISINNFEFKRKIYVKEKTKFIPLFLRSLNKKNTKKYLFFAFILLISSLFTKLGIYYLIFSTFLFFLSLYSFFNKKHNTFLL